MELNRQANKKVNEDNNQNYQYQHMLGNNSDERKRGCLIQKKESYFLEWNLFQRFNSIVNNHSKNKEKFVAAFQQFENSFNVFDADEQEPNMNKTFIVNNKIIAKENKKSFLSKYKFNNEDAPFKFSKDKSFEYFGEINPDNINILYNLNISKANKSEIIQIIIGINI